MPSDNPAILPLEPVPALVTDQAEVLVRRLIEQTENLVALAGRLDTELIFAGPAEALRFALRPGRAMLADDVLAEALLAELSPAPPLRARRGEWSAGGQREVALLVIGPAQTWTLARRPFTRGVDGVGTWLGAWRLRRGEGFDGLPRSLRVWVQPRAASSVVLERRANPLSHEIRMGIVPIRDPMGSSPTELARVLGELVDQELREDGLPPFLVFVQRPGVLERWEVRGDPGCDPHDLIRGMANAEPASGVVLVHPAVVETSTGQRGRAISLRAEMAGESVQRVLPYENTDEGPLLGVPWLGPPRPVGHHEAWLGEAPRSAIPDLSRVALGTGPMASA